MYINTPDPHPGRCRNLRPSDAHPGSFLRCLDYEGLKHVCSFEKETIHSAIDTTIYQSVVKPKPWVKPRPNLHYVPVRTDSPTDATGSRTDGGW